LIRTGKLKISKDYAFTFITEFTVLLAGVLVYKFAMSYLSHTGFSEYTLSRRAMSFIHPVLILGMGVGIPRYLAFNATNKLKADSYFASGLIVLFSVTAFVLLLLNIFSAHFAYLLFGDDQYDYLIAPISVMLAGMVMHSACYSYFRGKVMMLPANLLQFLNLGLAPIAVFLIRKDITGVLYMTGITWSVIAAVFLIWVLSRLTIEKGLLASCARELLYYGVQRTPGDLAISGFLMVPASLAIHITNDINVGGEVGFGMTLLNMAGAAFGPISLILLPQASKLIASRDIPMLRSYTTKIFNWTLLLTLGGLLIFEVFADTVLYIFLGETNERLVLIVRLIITASVGYTVYISLRSILDAYHVKAVNTRNIFLSFIFFAACTSVLLIFMYSYMVVLYAFIASMLLLGALTLFETRKVLRKEEAAAGQRP
jgi:O-antigen/teichoic acid export membrane protein